MTHFNLYHFSKTTKPTLTVVTGVSHDLNLAVGTTTQGFSSALVTGGIYWSMKNQVDVQDICPGDSTAYDRAVVGWQC